MNMTSITRRPPRHRHTWMVPTVGLTYCLYCEKTLVEHEVSQKRGRTSLRAGKDAERHIAKAYGGTRTGMYGGPDDVLVGDLFIVQSKAGGWFSERYWNELAKLPRTGGRIPTLIVSERLKPGGKHARRMVIRIMSDDVDLHGTSSPTAEDDPISDARQPEDGPAPGRWPR